MSTEAEQFVELLVTSEEPVFEAYLDTLNNNAEMARYKTIFQYGKKAGESLYTHVLNGIFVLETLRPLLDLDDEETRVLYTAFTVHDINKALDSAEAFSKLATPEKLGDEIRRLGLDEFFPAWDDYVEDITELVRSHSGHLHVGGGKLIASRASRYRLGLARLSALVHLMRAADVVDLSHTLDERDHKSTFLGHLNAYLADSVDSDMPVQYEFFTHRLVEQRGVLTNVIHNAVLAHLQETYGMIPLLFYPEGVAYLVHKGRVPMSGVEGVRQGAVRVAETLNRIIRGDYEQFIKSTIQGIKVDSKCLELGVPFADMLRVIWDRVERRNLVPANLDEKARQRARRDFEKNKKAQPSAADEIQAALDSDNSIVSTDTGRLRLAELVRSYYIFLSDHFDKRDHWQRIYRLLDLPEERLSFYTYFDARYDRPYVLARDLALDWDEVYRRIEADGTSLLESRGQGEDAKVGLFTDYLARYLIFSAGGRPHVDFGDDLSHYVASQHKQCVHCGGPFPTDKWMTADVRSDITVQAFSNRLRGGPGEPKKSICAVCQLQFLLEKLNYPEVRGEKTLYIHLYPYSFLTGPFIEGLNVSLQRIRENDDAIQALNMRSADEIVEHLSGQIRPPHFYPRTQAGKPHPYGLYVPRFTEATGNLLIFPINPGGDNDTERFLFALWNTLVLQRYFGVKLLLSNTPVAPLGKEDFADLYVDNIPLACQGLLPHNEYAQFHDGTSEAGTLEALWHDVRHLFALRRIAFVREDKTPAMVRALSGSPLAIFYTVEKLLEARARNSGRRDILAWLAREAFEHVEALALSKGGSWMAQLSEELRRLAEIARRNWIAGSSWKKSSLIFPVSEVLDKLGQASRAADLDALRAATAQDIFDHLERIADEKYRPGRKKLEAIKQFVDGWYDNVLGQVYAGDLRRMMADEKLMRSAYLFYFGAASRAQDEPDSGEDNGEA